jgi:superfamily II DNA or RNA helicase
MEPHVFQHPHWAAQQQAAQSLYQAGYGTLQADTGWGKTIALIQLITLLQQCTLILVNEASIARQWLDHFEKHTNLQDLTRFTLTEPLVGVYDKCWYPITISTYQSFISDKGWERYLENVHRFGALIVDESHGGPAPRYADVISSSVAYNRFGCTATPYRRDHLERVMFDLLGPVNVKGAGAAMPVFVFFRSTGFSVWDGASWQKYVAKITESTTRATRICEEVYRDVEEGYNVLIFARYKKHIRLLQSILREQFRIESEMVVAETSYSKRSQIYQRMRDGELRVIISGQIMRQAVDINVMDCLHIAEPISGKNVQMLKQLTGRVRRLAPYQFWAKVVHWYDHGGRMTYGNKNKVLRVYEEEFDFTVLDRGHSRERQSAAAQWGGVRNTPARWGGGQQWNRVPSPSTSAPSKH